MKKALSGIMYSLLIMLTLAVFVPTSRVAYAASPASGPNLNNIVDDINKSNEKVIGDETKKKVTGLSKEIQEIVLVVIMAILLVSGSITATKFRRIEDDGQGKSKLKLALIGQVLAIVFLASYYGFVKFGLTNLKLF